RMQGVSFKPLLNQAKDKIRDFVFAEHNWHVFTAHTRMIRYKNWIYIKNWLPNRRLLCGESTRVFASGKELWDAHDKGHTTPRQENVFLFPQPKEELYNVKNDPNQFNNIANEKKNQRILSFLRSKLNQWVKETGDAVPNPLRPNREDVYGHILGKSWERIGEEPGASNNADKINKSGPIKE